MKKPIDRCLAMLEVKNTLMQMWANADTEWEKEQIELILVPVRLYLAEFCKTHGFPYDGT